MKKKEPRSVIPPKDARFELRMHGAIKQKGMERAKKLGYSFAEYINLLLKSDFKHTT